MKTFWFCRFYHKHELYNDLAATAELATLLCTPPFAAFRRAAVWLTGARVAQHAPISPALLIQHLRNPAAQATVLDSGRTGDLVATGRLGTSLGYEPHPEDIQLLYTDLVFPYREETREAVINGFCTIAELLRAVHGTAAVEPSFHTASNATGCGGPAAEDRATYTVMTDDRIRYRKMPGTYPEHITHAIGGPEWMTFLGPGHLARLPPAALQSPAFFQVRHLTHGGACLRLSADPLLAHTPAILPLVANARAALDPIILHDMSQIRIRSAT